MNPILGTSPLACPNANHTDPLNPTNASTTMQNGQAVFNNDNYNITMGDNNTVTINNKKTGETYQIAGDPHVSVDGQHAFDFWGTTTFNLDDGTKVTIQTTPYAANPSATLASKVTITNGDYGAEVDGVDTNTTGDLKINEAKGWGNLLDAVTDDGNSLQENPAGKGFLAVDQNGRIQAVDQNYINATDLTKGGAPKADTGTTGAAGTPAGQATSRPGCHSPAPSASQATAHRMLDKYRQAFDQIGSLLSIAYKGSFLNNAQHGQQGAAHDCGRGNSMSNLPMPHYGHHNHMHAL